MIFCGSGEAKIRENPLSDLFSLASALLEATSAISETSGQGELTGTGVIVSCEFLQKSTIVEDWLLVTKQSDINNKFVTTQA